MTKDEFLKKKIERRFLKDLTRASLLALAKSY